MTSINYGTGKRSEARLQVEALPVIPSHDKFEHPVVLHVGESAKVEVPFEGFPSPRVSWDFEGRPSYHVRVHDNDHGSVLFLDKVQKSHAGCYNMKLENEFGSCNLKVKVIVLGQSSNTFSFIPRDHPKHYRRQTFSPT